MARPGLRRYVAIPLLVNITLFGVGTWVGFGLVDQWLDGLLPQWLDWLRWLLWPVLTVLVMGVIFFGFNFVAMLVASPFNGLLAEAVERELRGEPPPPSGWSRMLRDLGRTLASEARKLVYVALRTVPLMVLALLPIPVVNALASVGLFAMGAWMLAFAYVDYPMGNHGLGFPEQRARLRERRLMSLGFGAAVMGALSIPVLNCLVIPSAVAGATALWVERLRPLERGGQ